MPKYFITGEMDRNKLPTDPKERLAAIVKMLEIVKQSLKEGTISDWGWVIGESAFYVVSEKDWRVVGKFTGTWPNIDCKVHQVASPDEMTELIKSMMQQR